MTQLKLLKLLEHLSSYVSLYETPYKMLYDDDVGGEEEEDVHDIFTMDVFLYHGVPVKF